VASAHVWVDAQLPPALARWLAVEHVEAAVHVQDVGLLAAPDPAIFEAARTAGVAVVVTKDEDFVSLLDRRGPPPQVVWVTCGNVRNAELRRIVQAAWPRVAELLAAGEPLVEIHQRT
jgi:predicted nuclease of predicted toxin-antitoxin system